MSRPVQEPTQGRVDQGQAFRTRQLYRRPAPPSGGAMPWVLVTNFATPTSLAIPGPTLLEDFVLEEFSGTDFVTISSGAGTDDTITIDEPGLYLAQRVDELEGSGGPTIPDAVRTSFNVGSLAPYTGAAPGDVFAYPRDQDDQNFVLMNAMAMFVVATTEALGVSFRIEDAVGTWIGYSNVMITRIST